MSTDISSSREFFKKMFLDLLEEDREFRYALMGLLGFREILDRITRLEERFVELEERVARLEEEARETRRVVLTIAHLFGMLSEEAMKYVVEDVFGVAAVEKWVYRDEEGFVYGYPSVVEVDVLVRDSEHILLEVKSRVPKADVSELHRIGQLYEKVERKKPRLVILGGFIDGEARRLAKRLGVEIMPIFSGTPH